MLIDIINIVILTMDIHISLRLVPQLKTLADLRWMGNYQVIYNKCHGTITDKISQITLIAKTTEAYTVDAIYVITLGWTDTISHKTLIGKIAK